MNTPKLSELRARLDGLSDTGRARLLSIVGFVLALSVTLFLYFYFDHDQVAFWSTSEGLTLGQSILATVLLFVMMLFSIFILK